jgi:hypothetical protein
MKRLLVALALVVSFSTAHAETPYEWVALGAQVHSGFGAFIPLGIKIGLDAVQRLNAKPRELVVVYYDSSGRERSGGGLFQQPVAEVPGGCS